MAREASTHWSPTAAKAALGIVEVENRPAVGLKTLCPEEPYVISTGTVLWELGGRKAPWLPELTLAGKR